MTQSAFLVLLSAQKREMATHYLRRWLKSGGLFPISSEKSSESHKPSQTDDELPRINRQLHASTSSSSQSTAALNSDTSITNEQGLKRREQKLEHLLHDDVARLDAIRQEAWTGVPNWLRPMVWKLLLGHMPANKKRREHSMREKRDAYRRWVHWYCSATTGAVPRQRGGSSEAQRAEDEEEEDGGALKQIRVDAPRTAPDVAFFRREDVKASVERVLYIWAVRHPASGYVQGINDLLTPFLAVFLSEHFQCDDMEEWDMSLLSKDCVLDVEADCYWCLERMLNAIHDHYTPDQPGIHARKQKMEEVLGRVHAQFAAYLQEHEIDLMQFAFRWINCLLLRELPFRLAPRLWDTFIAEGHAFRDFLPYVCAALLDTYSQQLMRLDFADALMFLQKLPTHTWDERSLEAVLSQAHVWRETFEHARAHLSSPTTSSVPSSAA